MFLFQQTEKGLYQFESGIGFLYDPTFASEEILHRGELLQ